jgi:hypothetical protein
MENIPQPPESPKDIGQKNFTQIISMLVGFLLFILGLCGILFSGFAGLHLSSLYSTLIAVSGGFLLYTGYSNRSRDAFLCCLICTIFYGLHAIAGWAFGSPGVPNIGLEKLDPKWIQIIPGIHELGKNDHVLNTILAFVLLGGAIDWWRRNTQKGHRSTPFREIKNEYQSHHSSNRPIRH